MHDIPQLMPSHVGVALVVDGQAVHEPPQFAVSLLLTHRPPQMW